MTLQDALNEWLESVKDNKSENTYKTSLAASREFVRALGDMPLEELDEDQYSIFLTWLKKFSPSTEKLYATIMYLFFEHLAYRHKHPVNIAAMRYLRRNETRRPGIKLREVDTEFLAEFRDFVFSMPSPEDLTLARAKAWITLAFESGLRAFEACGLRMNNLSLSKHYGVIVGKGNKQAKFYFTDRSALAIRWYFRLRVVNEQKRASNIPIEDQPVFISHSKRGFKHLSPIDTDTARADLRRVAAMFSDDVSITPHLIRHFFVNAILEATDNPETARKAARHESIATTQRYLHVDEKEVKAAHRKAFEKGGEK